MALTSDGSRLFVGLSGADAVQPINTASLTLGTQFALTSPQFPYSNSPAAQIAVLPGSSDTVVVSRQSTFVQGPELYVGGVVAPNNLDNSSGSAPVFVSPTELFCLSNFSGLMDVVVDSQGLTVLNTLDLFNNTNNISLSYDSGRVYASDGSVIDAVSKTRIGAFDLADLGSQNTAALSFALDVANHRIFFITQGTAFNQYLLAAFDIRTFLPVGSVNLPNIAFSSNGISASPNLVRFGAKGLAFRSPTAIYFLDHAPGL
jgi:hypothetical protein